MPNLNLTHSGNMNITSASLGSGGTLNVQYEPNLTGAITGWTITPESERTDWESGETITIRYVPQFSGTVLTETFTVSGVDEAGIQRSDTSVLRQGYDTDLRHYFANLSPAGIFLLAGVIVNSSAMTENDMEINVTLTGGSNNYVQVIAYGSSGGVYDRAVGIWYGYIDTTPPGPDTGTVASSLTLVVDDTITDYGQASAIYSPSNAYVDLHYVCVNLEGSAEIDENTGEITVLSTGTVYVLVGDDISELSDGRVINVIKSDEPGPDTGDTGVTAITISVADEIIETGIAVPIFSPSTAETSFVFTSSDDSIATIDSGGNITVLDNGLVTFCVEETISGLRDCKEVSVRKAVYIDSIEIVVADTVVLSDIATANYTPTAGTVSLVYTSSDPDKAFINPMTGEIIVYESGEVTFCVRDLFTNKSDCKTVNVKGPNDFAQFTYNVTSTSEPTLLFSNNSCCGDHWSDFSEAIYYNGVSITPNTKSYTFPETGEQTIYVEFKTYEDSGRILLNNCIFRDNTKLVKAKFPADYNVQATGNYTFYGCTNLREADLSCFTEIDYACFYGCTSLSSITIPNVEIIGESSFINTNLKNVYGPNVKTVNQMAFKGLTSLETAVFPSLIKLDRWAFQLSRLREFTFPATVETIGADAFDEAYSLRNLTFESTTVKSGWNAFGRSPVDNLSNLLNVWVPCGSVSAYKSWLSGYAGFSGSVRCLAGVNTITVPVTYHTDTAGKVLIMSLTNTTSNPSIVSVVSIKDTDGNELILEGASSWKGFGYIDLPSGDTVINVTFDVDSLNTNGLGDIFQGTVIKSIDLQGGWGSNSNMTFSGCTELRSLSLPSGLTSVPNYLCYNCTKLETVNIPNTVRSIGNGAFQYCERLMSISIPNGVTSIGDSAFYYAGYSGITSFVCVIPNSVTTIGTNAFTNAKFTEYEIGTGVRNIGDLAFCRSYSGTYWENGRITKMTIRATTPPTLGQHSIYGGDSSTHYPIYVPSQSLNAYKAANYYLPRTRLYSI